MGISSYRWSMGARLNELSLGRALALALVLILVAAMSAVPADAKKRKSKRSHYSPPQATMVIDAYTGKVLHAENADKPRFPASVTKVMTLYLLFEQIADGHMTPDTPLKVSAFAAAQSPSKLGLEPGSTILARDAMYALVTKSANDAAVVVAENIAGSEPAFGRMMTAKAVALGMRDTVFRNASGLPDPAQTTTARDLVTLGRRILADFPEQSKIFRTRFFQYGKARYKNHNGLLFTYAGTEGLKTGYTRASGFNLLSSCKRHDKHLIAVVLGGRSSAHRNARMRSLLDSGWRNAVALNDIKQRGPVEPVATATVFQDELMPERNPAFHPSISERAIKVALAETVETQQTSQAPSTPGEQLAVALASGPAEDDEEEGDTGDAANETVARGSAILGPYQVQVGSYLDAAGAKSRLADVAEKGSNFLGGHGLLTVPGEVRGKAYYRARFGSFSEEDAASTCSQLKRLKIDCLVVRAE
jgi:D-alanyl-D-alanine carboxypeptidase